MPNYVCDCGEPGYFVLNPKTGNKFSKRPLPKIMAEKQRTAIMLSEKRRGKYM
jgi:hypothetical protein